MSALEFWTGQGGDDYIERNRIDPKTLAQRVCMWNKILDHVVHPYSMLEVGANIGINISALRKVLPPSVKYYAQEPNEQAFETLRSVADVATCGPAHKLPHGSNSIDVVFTSGVLIHIEPTNLLASCKEMHRVASRYIICAEYFTDQPISIPYRGSFIWKRDFGKFWLDNFEDLRPIDCGFEWRELTNIDNITWWVFEKC